MMQHVSVPKWGMSFVGRQFGYTGCWLVSFETAKSVAKIEGIELPKMGYIRYFTSEVKTPLKDERGNYVPRPARCAGSIENVCGEYRLALDGTLFVPMKVGG